MFLHKSLKACFWLMTIACLSQFTIGAWLAVNLALINVEVAIHGSLLQAKAFS
jgi:hypothetical protein